MTFPSTGEKPAVKTFALYGLLLAAIAFEGAQLAPKFRNPPSESAPVSRLLELAAWEQRDLSLPVVAVTSSLVKHSIEYTFSPSKTSLRVFVPDYWLEDLRPLETDESRSLVERLDRWKAVLEESGMVYRGDHIEALNGEKGYVVAFELASQAMAILDASPNLELVHSSRDGSGRWYLSR